MVPPSYLARRLRRAYGWPRGEKNELKGVGELFSHLSPRRILQCTILQVLSDLCG